MKLLLTSAGITNDAIAQELRDLLGKPTRDCTIVAIPTAHNPDMGDKSWMLREDLNLPHALGWKNFGVIDIAAAHSLPHKYWWSQLEAADVLLVGGGNVFYLSYWMQKAGLFDALPKWLESKVYVGISAGSQVMCSDLCATVELMEQTGTYDDVDYDEMGPPGQSSAKTMQLADFTFRPHLNSPNFPKIRKDYLEDVAKTLQNPMYAIDDNCAISVQDGDVRVVGDGTWYMLGQHKKDA